jgi:hypothetical protein
MKYMMQKIEKKTPKFEKKMKHSLSQILLAVKNRLRKSENIWGI